MEQAQRMLKQSLVRQLCAGLFLLMLVLSLAAALPLYGEERIETGPLYRLAPGSSFNFLQMENLKPNLIEPKLSYAPISEEIGYAGSGAETVPVHTVFTTPEAKDAFGVTMLAGSFLDQTHMERWPQSAVISEQLAAKLFLGGGVGSQLQIGDCYYRVIGIYRDEFALEPFIRRTNETVYLSAYADGENRVVDSLFVYGLEEGIGEYQVRQYLAKKLGNSFQAAETYNTEEEKLVLQEYGEILRFLCFFFLLTTCVGSLKMVWRSYKKRFREALEEYELRQLPWRRPLVFWPPVVLTICILALAGWGLGIALFSIFIPENLIPKTNLFDITFYFKKMLSLVQASYTQIPAYHVVSALLRFLIRAEFLLCVGGGLLMLSVKRSMKRLQRFGSFEKSDWLWAALALGGGLFAGLVLCTAMSVPFGFPLFPFLCLFVWCGYQMICLWLREKGTAGEEETF